MKYLIAGLGNIGPEYAGTRHNLGFMALDAFAEASGAVFRTGRYGDIAEVSFRGRKLILLKPSTYMNLSGNAVRYWMGKENIPPERLLVICDDLNLPVGALRMREGGSDGGHNGLKNIAACIGTEKYPRMRIGIGNDYARGAQIDFVVGELTPEEKACVPKIGERVTEGIRTFVTAGVPAAMNVFNTKKLF